MANEQRRRFNFTTTTAATSSPAASTTVTCFRSQSAPPRKKWYRRGASLLTRQRSTRQQAADGTPACSMLYDQVVSRRLVGAIAAWHDLHASLLQLSLNQHAEQGADGAQTRGDQNTGSSSSSSVSPNGKQRKERLSSKAARSDRKKGGSSGACAGSSADGCRVHGARRAREGADAPPSPSRDSPISSAGAKMTPSGLIHTPSRSSSLASGGSSSANERHRRRHRQMVDRPDIDDEASSSHCTNLDILQGPPSSSEGRRRQQSPGGGGDISPNDNNNWTTRSAADFRRHPKAAGRASAGVVGEKPAPATWSATFAQSLKIRSSTRRRARSPIPRARSPAPTRQIVIKHSVQLVQPNHQPMPPGEWFDQPMPPPGLLSLTRSSTTAKTGYRRRCFNVEKVPENEGGAEEKRRRLRQQCSCRDGQSEGEEEEDWASGSGEEDEEEESGASSGILSDAELDCLYEEERNRPKMSMSSPELTPDQLKQLFPELSDHWRWA